MSPTRKRNPTDLTLRNLHALKKRLTRIEAYLKELHAWNKEVRERLRAQRKWDQQVEKILKGK